ncbi:MAG: PAS domain S-box protein [Promethearchaeota archaeon]
MKIITSNDDFAQILRYNSGSDVSGLTLWELLLPMDMQTPLMTLKQTGYFQGEVRAFTKGRDIILLDFTILDIHQFKIILGVVKDITEQQKTKKQLIESEARYRAFVENIREGLMILDEDQRVVFVNPVLCRILGYHKTDLINRALVEIINPEELKLIEAQLKDGDKKPFKHLEMRIKTKDGHNRSFLVSTAPLYDSESKYTGAIVVCVDVTDRDLESERLSDTRGVLLKIMMSEASEQLLLTRGWLDILQASLPEQHERVEKLIKIIEKAIRLNRQINELETLKPILEFPFLFVSIQKFILSLDELLKPLIYSKGCTIKFNLQLEQAHLYSCPRALMIAIEQIVYNSLIRFSNEISLDISLLSDFKMQIIITDNGKTFLETPESPETSKFLMDIYFADVLLREIGGKVTINNILPQEGLRFSLICPVNSRDG